MTIASRIAGTVAKLPRAKTYDVRVERDLPAKMADGTVLLADRWYPASATRPPIILIRCPYGRRQIGIVARLFAERGYQVVFQSCRGTFGSGGAWEPFRNEHDDGHATLAWLEEQEWFGGSVFTWGPSYLGLTQWSVIDDPPAALKGIAPSVTSSNFRPLIYPGESFALETLIAWVSQVEHQEEGGRAFVRGLVNGAKTVARASGVLPLADADVHAVGRHVDFYQEWVNHEQPGDPWWEAVDFSGTMDRVPPAALVGGWYDIFLPSQVADYEALVRAGRTARLTVGPWTHAGVGGGAESLRDGLDWFDTQLSGRSSSRSPVRLFVMGAKRWRDFASWPPPAEVTRWHLHAGGRLDPSEPNDSAPDRYRYDPMNPAPGFGGAGLNGRTAGRKDQKARESRPDVLTYTSDVLSRDITVAGPLTAEVHVTSDAASMDVFVRLCDVTPKGQSHNLSDGIVRVDHSGAIRVPMWPTANTFRAGHRIRLQVSSAAHPLYARNLGGGERIATATKPQVSEHLVHHDPDHLSGIDLPIVR